MGIKSGTVALLVGSVLGVSAVAFIMKPTVASFPLYFDKWLVNQITRKADVSASGATASSFMARVKNAVQQKFTTPVFYNLFVLRVVTLASRGNTVLFFGLFGRWFPLRVPQDSLIQSVVDDHIKISNS